MSALLKRAIEERASAWSELNGLRETINKRDGVPTAEESVEWDRIESVITERTATVEREQRAVNMETAFSEPVEDRNIGGGQAAGSAASDADERAKAYRTAFTKYLRHGMDGLEGTEKRALMGGVDREVRAQSEGTTTAGGFLVPTDYWVRITEVLKAYGGLQGVANQVTTSDGRTLPWPKNDDTANQGAWLGENVQVSAADLAFTQNNLSAYTASSNLVLVSLELIQDSAFDLDSWIPKKLGQRLGRVLASAFMNGSGTAQPTGLIANVPVGNTITGATGVAGAFTYANLVDVQHKIDPAYRQMGNARWIFSDNALATLLKLTDSYGHPLWQPTISQAAPDFLLGNPVTIDQATPVVGLSNVSVLFGDFESAYVVRTVQGGTIMRLTERYADFLQVGLFGFVRVDGKPDDVNAVSAFKGGAT